MHSTDRIAARDAFLNLVRVHERLTAEFATLFRARGLTLAQYNVLRILRGGPAEGASCQYIGQRLLNRVPDVTRLLDRMETAGLVQRRRSDADRRVVLTALTERGLALCNEFDEPVLELHGAQFERLRPEQLEQLDAGLRALLAPQEP